MSMIYTYVICINIILSQKQQGNKGIILVFRLLRREQYKAISVMIFGFFRSGIVQNNQKNGKRFVVLSFDKPPDDTL